MIRIKNLNKKYGNKVVLNGTSFSVETGEVYGLIGKNGAGKTTLMTIISGLNKADDGEIIYEENSKIGYLPDVPAFFESLKTDEYLDYLLKNKNKEKRNKLLKLVGLEPNNRISSMSRGMRQRLGLASALVNDPDIVLLDEPTSALDPEGRLAIFEIINKLKEDGKTVILSTHILSDMENVCDKVGFLKDGHIKEEHLLNASSKRKVAFTFKDSIEESPKISPKVKINNKTIEIDFSSMNHHEIKTVLEFIGNINSDIISIKTVGDSLTDMFTRICE